MAFDNTVPPQGGSIVSQPIRDNFNALKTQIDVAHNADGTHKDVLKATDPNATGDVKIKKASPAVRLIGTEANAKDVRLIEAAGYLIAQKNTGTEATPVWVDAFKLDLSNFLITVAKITEANLDASTVIPDSKLATITTAGKIADTALPASATHTNRAALDLVGSNGKGNRFISTGDPSGGSNGDIWYKVGA